MHRIRFLLRRYIPSFANLVYFTLASSHVVSLTPSWGSKPPGRPEEFHLQPPTEPPLDLHGSPFSCPLAMAVDAESDCSSRSLGWRPPSLSWVIRFAPRSLQVLRRYYRMIRPRHAHRYFPPSCFALKVFPSHGMTSSQVPSPD